MAKKKQTKARQAAVNEYKKQRRRVQQTVSRAQKRGYRFPTNLIPEPIKKLTNISTQKLKSLARQLKELTAPKIYKEATAVSEVSGEIITGTERRQEERREAARKARETKLEKEWGDIIAEVELEKQSQQEYDEWIKQRRAKDEENRKKLEHDAEYQRMFNMGEITYTRIENAIQTIDTNHKNAAAHLKKILDDEIATFGKQKVLFAIGQAPSEMIAACEVAGRYNPGDDRHDEAILALQELIQGHILSEREQKEANEALLKDAVFSPPADE